MIQILDALKLSFRIAAVSATVAHWYLGLAGAMTLVRFRVVSRAHLADWHGHLHPVI